MATGTNKNINTQARTIVAMSGIVALANCKSSTSSTCSNSGSQHNYAAEYKSMGASSRASPRERIAASAGTAVTSKPKNPEEDEQRASASADQLLFRRQYMPSRTECVAGLQHQSALFVQQQKQYRHAGCTVDITASNNYASSNVDTFQNVAAAHSTAHIGQSRQKNSENYAFEQYRFQQLYNYALSIERLRCPPPYSTTAGLAAAVSCVNSGSGMYAPPNSATNYPLTLGGGSNIPAVDAVACGGGQRLALSMSILPECIFQPREPKPQHSYIGLIAMAILSSSERKLILSDIYQYILDNYPYFRTRGPGWRNSIRHNLSLNDCFIKAGRSVNGKGHYWAVHPANKDDFRKGDFRRRKAQRKVRKHMGLSVEDAGTDSLSPPLLNLTRAPPPAINVFPPHHPLAAVPAAVALPHSLAAARQLPAAAAAHRHAATVGYLLQHRQPHIGLTTFHPKQQAEHPLTTVATEDNLPPDYAMQLVETAGPQQKNPYTWLNQSHAVSSSPRTLDPYINKDDSTSTVSNHHHESGSGSNSTTNSKGTVTACVIANLYSQTRKRQFDVASLLEPDIKVDIVNATEATTTTTTTTLQQHTVITKVSMQHQQKQQQKIQRNLLLDLADVQEDIVDVEELLSEDELLEEKAEYVKQLQEDEKLMSEELMVEQKRHGQNLQHQQQEELPKADEENNRSCCLVPTAMATRRLLLESAIFNRNIKNSNRGIGTNTTQTSHANLDVAVSKNNNTELQMQTGNTAKAMTTSVATYQLKTLGSRSRSSSNNNNHHQTDEFIKCFAANAEDALTTTHQLQLQQQQHLDNHLSGTPNPSNRNHIQKEKKWAKNNNDISHSHSPSHHHQHNLQQHYLCQRINNGMPPSAMPPLMPRSPPR